jgi:hypothetical protein
VTSRIECFSCPFGSKAPPTWGGFYLIKWLMYHVNVHDMKIYCEFIGLIVAFDISNIRWMYNIPNPMQKLTIGWLNAYKEANNHYKTLEKWRDNTKDFENISLGKYSI